MDPSGANTPGESTPVPKTGSIAPPPAIGGFSVMVALADLVLSATLVAVTVTVCGV